MTCLLTGTIRKTILSRRLFSSRLILKVTLLICLPHLNKD